MQKDNSRQDCRWMAQAIRQARKGLGRTSPNPPVGAVIVKNGTLISSGWHRKAGTDHAEVDAIRKAGTKAIGATIYVTLEPCSTTGRTGPCTSAIVNAGIRRVVTGSVDPNPAHQGRGLALLRRKGIDVTHGTLSGKTDEIIAPFKKHQISKLPFLTLKMAMSLDGRITDTNGKSKWISSVISRKSVRTFRGKVDAVMVGIGTVIADNPELCPARSASVRPYRVVVDTHGKIPLSSRLLTDQFTDKTIVVTGTSCPENRAKQIAAKGATVIRVREKAGRVSLKNMMQKLAGCGIMHILCEGGAALAASLANENLIDEYQIYSAPVLLGSKGCLPVLAESGWTLRNAPLLEIKDVRRSGGDLFIRCVPKGR